MSTMSDSRAADKKLLLVAQELKLARVLAGNDKKTRDRALKSLAKWFRARSETLPFTLEDFMRVWKGLFYSMWMSDKPLIQEECAENIAKLLHCPTVEASILFFEAGLQTLMNEWFGIDQLRLDKFLMLARRLLRQAFVCLKEQNFSKKSVKQFTDVLSRGILNPDRRPPMGLFMHFTEIYLEELSKVSLGKIHADRTSDLIQPFVAKLIRSTDGRDIGQIRKFVFTYLIRQHDLGLQYQEKYQAWKQAGFPGSIDGMQRFDAPETNEEPTEDTVLDNKPKALDPRAGRVDVELPQIKFNPKQIQKAFLEVKFDPKSTTKARKMVTTLSEHFDKLSKGVYPLGVKKIDRKSELSDYDMNIRKAVNRLVKFDKKIMGKKRPLDTNNTNDKDEEVVERKKLKLDKQSKNKMQKNYSIGTPIRKTVKKALKQGQVDQVFKRNSGTWVVFKTEEENKQLGDFLEAKLVGKKRKKTEFEETEVEKKPISPKIQANLFAAPKQKQDLFPKSDWDEPLKDGEYEIVIPAKKVVLQAKEKGVKIKGKCTYGAQSPKQLKSVPGTPPSSSKKVKINTKLNQCQEVYEHMAQLKNSPGIPFDANRKPSKPLLKATGATPINPFYKQKRWF